MFIPYARPNLTEEDIQAVAESLRGKQLLQGEQTRLFEEELAWYQQMKRAVFVNSGSSALLTAAYALAERRRGEVIVPGIGFPTLYNSLLHAGFQLVVVDVDNTLTLDTTKAAGAITKETVGIAVVHVAGNIGHLDELRRLADAYGLWLLEDNCDGFGGMYGEKRVGSFGDVSVTSFHVAHILNTGQGGAVFTNDSRIADAVIGYKDWGRFVDFSDNGPGIPPLPQDHMQRYTYTRLGFNLSPLELQAVLGRRQLQRMGDVLRDRDRNHYHIQAAALLAGFQAPDQVVGQSIEGEALTISPAWFACPLKTTAGTPNRFRVFQLLKEAGIEYRNIISGNITQHPAYRGRLRTPYTLNMADRWGRDGFWVSCHSSLTVEEVFYVEDFFKKMHQ